MFTMKAELEFSKLSRTQSLFQNYHNIDYKTSYIISRSIIQLVVERV